MDSNSTLPVSCPATGVIVDGDTSWVLASAAMVLLMTPGVGFFYGGMVRRKNMVNTLFMSFASMSVVIVQWVLFGYSFAFGPGGKGFGNFLWGGLRHVSVTESNSDYAPSIPHIAFMNFQMMFAVITPALISGSIVERMSVRSYLIFIFIWTTIIYDPLAHWMWSAGSQLNENGECVQTLGWLRTMGAIDFAGGTVIHISSGVAGAVASLVVGKRADYDPHKPNAPANVPLVVLGTGLLWFGWLGFNGGSAVAANSSAALAATNTSIAAAASALTWMLCDAFMKKSTPVIGGCVGAVVGLVVITPASGYIVPGYSIILGVFGAVLCYFPATKLKPLMKLDDSLDAFFCHGLGGTVGALMTGLFATTDVNTAGAQGAFYGNGRLLGVQLLAVVIAIAYSAIGTAVILLAIKYTIGLRAGEDQELDGLDQHAHGEDAYDEEGVIGMVVKHLKKTNTHSSEETELSSNGKDTPISLDVSQKVEEKKDSKRSSQSDDYVFSRNSHDVRKD